ncbi:MAG: tyrosine-type recombinase/integrase [Paracoccaceae bacterium]
MVRKRYLHEPKPGFLYVRKGGKYLGRITAPEGTPDFDRQYWDILTGRSIECKTSWRALIASYRRSDRWTALKPRTRVDYEKVLLYIEEKNGSKDATRLIRKDVIAAMEKNRHRVRFANYIPQVMSVLCEHAIDLGWMKDNPAKGVRRLATPDSKKQPHIPWPDWAVEKWRAEAAPLPRLIFEIGVGSVQRPGDWPKFRWGDYDGDSLRITQGKTGKALWLPCTGALKAALDSAPKKGLTILTRPDGSPMDYRYLARVMREERERLELTAYDLHALRYRGVMELAWAGCDDDEIASYSGHSSKDMIRKYAGEARQVMRARQAREKRQ